MNTFGTAISTSVYNVTKLSLTLVLLNNMFISVILMGAPVVPAVFLGPKPLVSTLLPSILHFVVMNAFRSSRAVNSFNAIQSMSTFGSATSATQFSQVLLILTSMMLKSISLIYKKNMLKV
eukprot:Lithocolla_globosa_v1_NODE_4842_length_1353_cov_35.879815.p2 type:complete len:121 gc:universal NODE_4842_length_1353_cov_35.879815:946-1308(+)